MRRDPHVKHGWVTIALDRQAADTSSVSRFLKEAAVLLDAEFALVHLLTPPDIETGTITDTVMALDKKRTRYSLDVTTHDIRRYLPDLYWATVFGPAYIEHFGRDRLLSAPAPVVEELDGRVYLQLSADYEDLERQYEAVDSVRRRVKAFLNRASFFDPDAPPTHQYLVPEFQFTAE